MKFHFRLLFFIFIFFSLQLFPVTAANLYAQDTTPPDTQNYTENGDSISSDIKENEKKNQKKNEWYIYYKNEKKIIEGPFDTVEQTIEAWINNPKIKPQSKYYIGRNGRLFTDSPESYYRRKYEEIILKIDAQKEAEKQAEREKTESAKKRLEEAKTEKASEIKNISSDEIIEDDPDSKKAAKAKKSKKNNKTNNTENDTENSPDTIEESEVLSSQLSSQIDSNELLESTESTELTELSDSTQLTKEQKKELKEKQKEKEKREKAEKKALEQEEKKRQKELKKASKNKNVTDNAIDNASEIKRNSEISDENDSNNDPSTETKENLESAETELLPADKSNQNAPAFQENSNSEYNSKSSGFTDSDPKESIDPINQIEEEAKYFTFELPLPSQKKTDAKDSRSIQSSYLSDYIAKDMFSVPEFEESNLEQDYLGDANETDSKGVSILMKAVREGNDWKIRTLLKSGAKVNAQDKEGWTPLMYAARYQSNLSIMELLLSEKADVKISNNYSLSPLVIAACFNDNPDVIKKLLSFYSPSDKEVQKAFVQLISTQTADNFSLVSKVKIFLDFGLPVNSYYDGKTPLMYACKYCTSTKIIKLLLDKKAEISVRSTEGKTAFDYAKTNKSLPRDDIYWSLNKK
ncbi:MAG: ankyrin repeat domain-containing protein [Treponema sp.]|nr:ankyrin repeat domain-containing protein [Treponema sp.]